MSKNEPFAHLDWEGRNEQPLSAARLHHLASVVPAGLSAAQSFPNLLIEGDNLEAMSALMEQWENRIDLIYIDPPFLSGKAYQARIGRGEDSRRPDTWQTTAGYMDSWEDGSAYLNMLYPRLQAIHRLLAPTGTLYLHLDWHAAAYARVMLDEIFGPQRLLNEIIWVYHGPSPIRSAFKRKHDNILVYTRSEKYTFNADAVRVPYQPSTHKTFASSKKAGFGKTPNLDRGKVPEDWWYFPVVARLHNERTGYPTQKPEALIERILKASSNPGDVVADFFCGSGTVPALASRLGRSWIGADASPLAIRTTQRRLALSPTPEAYSLQSTRHADLDDTLQVSVQVRQDKRKVSCTLLGLSGHDGELRGVDEIIYWEVDWDFGGDVFLSQAQASRPWRKGVLPLTLENDYAAKGIYKLRIHAVDASGRDAWSAITLNLV